MLAIPGLDGRFLHNRLTDFDSVTWTSLGATPATRRYKVRLWRISIHGVRHPSESGLLSLTILNSMADSSTTAESILNPTLGRRWTRRQLHAGIKDVTVGPLLMKSLSTLVGGPGKAERRCWRPQDSMADSSTAGQPIFDPSPGRRWTRRQLHAGIKDVTVGPILMKSLSTLVGGPGKSERRCWRSQDSMADSFITV